MTQPRQFVAYYRVSTDKQGRSGLGMDAQTTAVQQHQQRSGGEIIAAFQEVESGKHSDRPQLQAALKLCRQKKAVLLIAKLDRLSRNLAFIANLIESQAEFVACDNPHASKTLLQMMAVFAEHERDAISQRTKDALQAAKARGQKLGNPRPDLVKIHHQRADQSRQFREGVYPLIKQLRDDGMTLRAVADHLNERGIKSQNDRLWHLEAVRLVLLRHDELAYKSPNGAEAAA
jgi:DNA invertase Pin-like site-specific DNA recombinase